MLDLLFSGNDLLLVKSRVQEEKPAKTWEGGDAHYNFAIYASGRAYVPDIVDNLLCQVGVETT